jgi:hypothetical protein
VKLLDTPVWASLTVRQKNIMLAVQGNGTLAFRAAQRGDLEELEELGLVTVDWARRVASEATS